MESEEYKKMYQLEKSHWWFVSKRRLVKDLLRKSNNSLKTRLLDIGCGTGANLEEFSEIANAVGIDISPLAIQFSKMRGCRSLVRGSIDNLPFKNNVFNRITLLDVMYHRLVKEESISEVYRVLSKNGKVIITDSAFEFLRGPHDSVVHGIRRYNKRGLAGLAAGNGFKIERITYINFLLFPLVYATRCYRKMVCSKTVVSSDLKKVNPVLNCFLIMVQKFERFLLRFANLPIGSSILCILKK